MHRIKPVTQVKDDSNQLRSIDAQNVLDGICIEKALATFKQNGAVHIFNTGILSAEALLPFLDVLGFGQDVAFTLGGRTSEVWQKKWKAPGLLRRMDYYPPHLTLLPNNEVQYQRSFPQKVLLYRSYDDGLGGENFVHAAKDVEDFLRCSDLGVALLEDLSVHGMTIETGFLDQNHPEKSKNYFQSWQERFDTQDPDEALLKANVLTGEYDACWWRAEDDVFPTLMTRITLPSFFHDKRDGVNYLRFPRIAMDGPKLQNGYRCFPLGNGRALSEAEKTLLKQAYFETRQGSVWKTGDIVLMDNIRFAHSREPFKGKKELLVAMAGYETVPMIS